MIGLGLSKESARESSESSSAIMLLNEAGMRMMNASYHATAYTNVSIVNGHF